MTRTSIRVRNRIEASYWANNTPQYTQGAIYNSSQNRANSFFGRADNLYRATKLYDTFEQADEMYWNSRPRECGVGLCTASLDRASTINSIANNIGNDIITLNKLGNVTNVDTSHQGPDIIVDENGNTIFDGFERNGQFLETYRINGDGFRFFGLGKNNFKLGKNLFKSLADFTNVEWALNQYNGDSYIHSEGKGGEVEGFPEAAGIIGINNFRYPNWTISVHSHKGGQFTPSDKITKNGVKYGDIPNLKRYGRLGARNLNSFIYTPNYRRAGEKYNLLYRYARGGIKVTSSFSDAIKTYRKWYR